MSSKEKEQLISTAISYVEKISSTKWVQSFLKDLKIAYKPRSTNYFLGRMNSFGMSHRAIFNKSDLRRLNM